MLQALLKKLRTYLRRLLFPLYLFPLKLFTYSLYYALRALEHDIQITQLTYYTKRYR